MYKKIILGAFMMLTVLSAKPNIMILATGGTIAGQASSANANTGYKAGALGVDVLLKAVPELKNIANISTEQIANIDSSNMNDEIWLKLAKKVNQLMNNGNIDGIVITHGTDTMEETAYFLNLVTKGSKPVVLVGAMRPATATSADGPKNLYNAVALAGSKNALNRGVMVAMNDKIYAARDVTKTHTLNVETFKAPNAGEIGYIVDGKAVFNHTVTKEHTRNTPFDVSSLMSLPKVDIIYTYSNDGSQVASEAFVKAGAKGLVVAGSGAGSIHENSKNYLIKLLKEKKVFVVKSSRVGSGLVPISKEELNQGFISANDLNPQKARVLLMLALTKTKDPRQIAKYFEYY